MKDWQDDWKIPVITKDMPKGKEVEAGSSKTSAGGSIMTKKPTQQVKPGPKTMQQKKGSAPKKDGKIGKKDNAPVQEEQGRGDTMTQETPSKTTLQETGPPKWTNHTYRWVHARRPRPTNKSWNTQSPRMMLI
jgi:hypothetical protein